MTYYMYMYFIQLQSYDALLMRYIPLKGHDLTFNIKVIQGQRSQGQLKDHI